MRPSGSSLRLLRFSVALVTTCPEARERAISPKRESPPCLKGRPPVFDAPQRGPADPARQRTRRLLRRRPLDGCRRGCLGALEADLRVMGVHPHGVALGKAPFEELERERVLD